MRLLTSLALSLALTGPLAVDGAKAQVDEPARLFERMAQRVEAEERRLIALRHNIHRHPELSGEEVRTAGLVADRLADLGFDVRTDVGGHGVIGVLEGRRPGPVVAFRADMDAVRSTAPDPVAYRSVVPGVRHICGHDVHTAIGLGIAEGFAAIRDELPGAVMLLFQPAEERGTGAKAMLADGAFDDVTPDAVFALHTAPYNVGDVATVEGGMMAGRASLSVRLRGSGDLAAAASEVRAAIEGVGTFTPESPGDIAPPGFVMVQLFPSRSSDGHEVEIRGQVMTAGLDDRARAKAAILDSIESLELPDVSVGVMYDERFLEGVNNDATLVAQTNAGIEAHTPEIAVRQIPGAVPVFSEDFGSFQARVPGVMYFLGVSNPEAGTVGMPHSPNYVADDAAILVGTRAMLAAMLERMTAGG